MRTINEHKEAILKKLLPPHNMTITEFCKKHHITQSSFYKHKKLLSAKTNTNHQYEIGVICFILTKSTFAFI